jgi:hypothetical protein
MSVELSNELYYDASGPEKIFDKITKEEAEKFPGFEHLVFAKIKFLFKDKLAGSGWNKLGKLNRVNDLYWSLLDLDFIIVLNKQIWDKMEIKEKVTLVLHVISKIKVYYKLSSGKRTLRRPSGEVNYDITSNGRINYKVIPPDVEVFESVSERFADEYNKLKELSIAEEKE